MNIFDLNPEKILDLIEAQQKNQTTSPSGFSIQFRFNLSENISQVRVSYRKSWVSTVAEFMAYLAGLSFWAKLFKYLMQINHVGKFYDRRYSIYVYEEREQK